MALLGSPGGWRTNSRTWAGEGGGGAGSRLDKLGLSQEGTSRTTRGLLAPASPGQQRGGDRRQSDSEHGGGAQGRGGSLRGPAGLLPSPALLSLDDTGCAAASAPCFRSHSHMTVHQSGSVAPVALR